jgi:hypothetical protein
MDKEHSRRWTEALVDAREHGNRDAQSFAATAGDTGKRQMWHRQSSECTSLLNAEQFNQTLADDHRLGPRLRDVAEEFLELEVVGAEQREPCERKWELLRPLLNECRIDDVEDILLKLTADDRQLEKSIREDFHGITFLRSVLRYARQHERGRRAPTTTAVVANTADELSRRAHVRLATWINDATPNGFGTMLLPLADPVRVREHSFYVSLWTRQAECALWGHSALTIRNYADRVLWFVVQEISGDGLVHYHTCFRMPERPMKVERTVGTLPVAERCALMQDALVDASRRTPEPFASSPLDDLRGADILVKPYKPSDVTYSLKQRPLDRHDPNSLFILPAATKKMFTSPFSPSTD